MLTGEENELLTQVGGGTLMGDFLRQYWLPALLSMELPDPDGPPLRVRLLGEDLIAFRDSGGMVGLLGDHCPHRGASLFFGRNEEHGLRCVYHGWKFDAAGRCMDMPNEPPESNFKHKIRHLAYPCRERNGMIWAYMGPDSEPPGLPELEWNLVPESQRYISKTLQHCNWVQALEGGIDTSHASFLHHGLPPGSSLGAKTASGHRVREIPGKGVPMGDRDQSPRFDVLDTDYGLMVAAQRDYDEEHYSYQITQLLMPFYTSIGHAWVPMDVEHTITWSFSHHPARNLTEAELIRLRTYPQSQIHVGLNALLPPTSAPMGAWRPIPNKGNDYLIDREHQRTKSYTGIGVTEVGRNSRIQDDAVQESMGPIYDRTKEHLGTTDLGIIRTRRYWLRAAKALREHGTAPPGVLDPSVYLVRGAAVLVPKSAPESWVKASEAARIAHLGEESPRDPRLLQEGRPGA